MTFSCTTALWDARASEVPKGFTLGRTQKDSVEGTVREQSGPRGQEERPWVDTETVKVLTEPRSSARMELAHSNIFYRPTLGHWETHSPLSHLNRSVTISLNVHDRQAGVSMWNKRVCGGGGLLLTLPALITWKDLFPSSWRRTITHHHGASSASCWLALWQHNTAAHTHLPPHFAQHVAA